MRKIIFFIFISVVIVAGIFFYVGRITAPAEKDNPQGLNWIEVISPSVNNSAEEPGEDKQMFSGDEISAPTVLATGPEDFINVHLANGSIIRLGNNTEIELEEIDFNRQKNSLTVKIFLKTGQVWSKIIEPLSGSLWEVKTSNAVVAAQAAAFGVEYIEGKTLLVVSENKASLTVIDPEKEKTLADSTVIVPANEIMEVYDADIEGFKTAKKFVKNFVRQEPSIWQQIWVANFVAQDMIVSNKVSSLRSGGLDEFEIQKEMVKYNLLQMQQQLSNRVVEN